MDTDLLDFSSTDSTADNGELYGAVSAVGRPVVPLSSGSVGTYSKLGAVVDKVEPPPPQPVNPQATIPVTAGKPDPPPPHCSSAQLPYYKSPGSANDGALSAVVVKPRPDLPQKTSPVPAIPPRKPRIQVPGRPEATLSKTTQPQPPLPRVNAVVRKSTGDSYSNRMYGLSMVNSPQASLKPCTVEANGNAPPVPIPRNISAVNSEPVQVPAMTSATMSSDSPVPSDAMSSGEHVSK